MIYAFIDSGDGYYQVDVPDGMPLPGWTAALTPTDVQTPPPAGPPQVVTRFQARAALHLADLLTTVEALMSDPGTDALARLAWTDAQEFRRQSPTVLAMAGALGLTEQQLDDLFTTAASIEA